MAVRECLEGAGISSTRKDLPPILLAIDGPDRPDHPPDFARQLLKELEKELGKPLSTHSAVFPGDTMGFFRALEQAKSLTATAAPEGCVVAAADSLLNGKALHWLQDKGRLKTELNPDGVIPGEAAAAVWVQPATGKPGEMAQIRGIGFADEPSLLQKGEANLSVGLAEAMKKAIAAAALQLPQIDFRVGGMTGERRGFMEASTALARIQRVHKDDFELWVPAEKLGDVGAALPACMMVVTSVALARGYAPGRSALLYIASRSPARAACVVTAPGGPGGN
jgi:3-oxoacyl-[acyl-carrier-protein] synthase-1